MTRPEGSAEELEMRRKLAVRLLDYGMDGKEVAEAFDVSPGSVSRWKQTYETEGIDGLAADPHPGKEPILDDEQLIELATYLRDGPRAYGFEDDFWTRERVAAVIEEEFDASVSEATAYRYLRKMGWNRKTPDTDQPDGEAIDEWRQEQCEQVHETLGSTDD